MKKPQSKSPLKSNIQKIDNNAFFAGELSEKNENENESFNDEYYGLGGVTQSYYKKSGAKKMVILRPSDPKPTSHFITYTKPVVEPVTAPKLPSAVNLPASYPINYTEEQSFEAQSYSPVKNDIARRGMSFG